MLETTPSSRFTINGNGTVTDKQTGLIWARCPEGQSGSSCESGSATGYNWQSALDHADSSGLAGENDWRLPNIKELGSIIERACYLPAINLHVFPNVSASLFWTSSPEINNSNNTWVVDFSTGFDRNIDDRSSSRVVRLVRGGY